MEDTDQQVGVVAPRPATDNTDIFCKVKPLQKQDVIVSSACSQDEAALFTEWIGGMLAADHELAREASKDDQFNELLRHVCRSFEDGDCGEAEAAMHLALERFNGIQNRAFTNRRAAKEAAHG